MRKLGFDVEDNDLPIVAFTFGNNADIQKLRNHILSKDIYIQILNYAGTGTGHVLRIVVFSNHTHEDIDKLLSAISTAKN
jgi:7-keto-8-aminopelargonate synthetase-like enzyme